MGLAEDWMWVMQVGEETPDLEVSGSNNLTSPRCSWDKSKFVTIIPHWAPAHFTSLPSYHLWFSLLSSSPTNQLASLPIPCSLLVTGFFICCSIYLQHSLPCSSLTYLSLQMSLLLGRLPCFHSRLVQGPCYVLLCDPIIICTSLCFSSYLFPLLKLLENREYALFFHYYYYTQLLITWAVSQGLTPMRKG